MGLFGRKKPASQNDGEGVETESHESASEVGVRNDPVREALAVWAVRKDAGTFGEVMRRAVTGELLLDITDSTIADPEHPMQVGDTLAITSQRDNAGKRLLLAFTGNDELTRSRGGPGRSLVEPAAAVLARAARDDEGIVIDGRSPGAFIAYAPEIHQQFDSDPERAGRLAEIVADRSLSVAEHLAALAEGPVYIPFDVQRDESGAETGIVIPSVAGPDGQPYAVIGTAPAEIWAFFPSAGAQRTGIENVIRAVVADGQAGLVVNPGTARVTIPVDLLRPYAD